MTPNLTTALMKLTNEIVNGIKYWIAESDYLNIVAQGKTMQEALDSFDKLIYTSVRLSKRKGVDYCMNFRETIESIA